MQVLPPESAVVARARRWTGDHCAIDAVHTWLTSAGDVGDRVTQLLLGTHTPEDLLRILLSGGWNGEGYPALVDAMRRVPNPILKRAYDTQAAGGVTAMAAPAKKAAVVAEELPGKLIRDPMVAQVLHEMMTKLGAIATHSGKLTVDGVGVQWRTGGAVRVEGKLTLELYRTTADFARAYGLGPRDD